LRKRARHGGGGSIGSEFSLQFALSPCGTGAARGKFDSRSNELVVEKLRTLGGRV
jgi:hypothetical protein